MRVSKVQCDVCKEVVVTGEEGAEALSYSREGASPEGWLSLTGGRILSVPAFGEDEYPLGMRRLGAYRGAPNKTAEALAALIDPERGVERVREAMAADIEQFETVDREEEARVRAEAPNKLIRESARLDVCPKCIPEALRVMTALFAHMETSRLRERQFGLSSGALLKPAGIATDAGEGVPE